MDRNEVVSRLLFIEARLKEAKERIVAREAQIVEDHNLIMIFTETHVELTRRLKFDAPREPKPWQHEG
jgi:hypothetical protein